jgi:hypothetical protein
MMQSPSGARVTAPETDASVAPMSWLQQVVLHTQVGGELHGHARPGGVEEGLGALFEGVAHPRPHSGRVREQPFREGLLPRPAGLGQVQGPLACSRVGERRRRVEGGAVAAARSDERGGHIRIVIDPVHVVQLLGKGRAGAGGDQEVGL